MADLVFCTDIVIAVVYRMVYASHDEFGADVAQCKWFSFVAEFFGIAAEGYFLMISVDLLISISNPFTNHRVNRLWYAVL